MCHFLNCSFLDAYERDSETGLDFAQARYYGNVQGRFTSPDPLLVSGRTGNPQSWNRYSFVLNRPLNLSDPSGMVDEEAQKKKVYIFVALPPEQQSTTAPYRPPSPADNPAPTQTVNIPAPNFNSLKGDNVSVSTGTDVTREAVKSALADEGAAVVFIGHGAYYMDTPGQIDARDVKMGDQSSQLLFNGKDFETLQVRAETVCVMACDSANFAGSAFSGAKNIIAIESGSGTSVDTTTHSLARSGFAAAQQLIDGKGPDAAVAAANRAFTPTATVNGQPVSFPRSRIDVGDRALRIK